MEAVDSLWYGSSTNTAPCYVTPKQAAGKDFFTVGQWLQSVGVSLDDASKPGKSTLRYDGVIILIEVYYSNFREWNLGQEREVRYAYKPRIIPSSGYKTQRIVSTNFPE